MNAIRIPAPSLQIDFSYALDQIRGMYLHEALSATVAKLDITRLDLELGRYVPKESLNLAAQIGLRGELLFAVPLVLEINPFLLGYYRLLLGFSQKEFYSSKYGVSGFKPMEAGGKISSSNMRSLPNLCSGLISSAAALVDGIGPSRLSKDLLRELTLLTIGPQLRGGANVKIGLRGIVEVFESINKIVSHSVLEASKNRIVINNAAKRKVIIQLYADPDIIIKEDMSGGGQRNIIAIEVKGGTDFSNIHNRLGEAEKSHQKARQAGFTECWTIVNVDKMDKALARRESPSTDQFYLLSSLSSETGVEYRDFKSRIISLTGIKSR